MLIYHKIYLEHHPELNGIIPKGYMIHHIDENRKNNNIENLQLVTYKEHKKIHGIWNTGKNNVYTEEQLINISNGTKIGMKNISNEKRENMKRYGNKYNCKTTEEMIEDVKNGIKRIDFLKKYSNVSQGIYYHLKNRS